MNAFALLVWMFLPAGGSARNPSPTPMERLAADFARSKPPRIAQLEGKWVLIRSISTERFLTGHDGADHVSFDPHGLRATQDANSSLEWTLEFRATGRDRVQLRTHPAWSSEESYPLVLKAREELVLDSQWDGDTDEVYRCRISDAGNLVCILEGSESGNGVEFTKVAN